MEKLFYTVLAGLIMYVYKGWWRVTSTRRQQSLIAVSYLSEIKHELETGIERLEYLYTHGGTPMAYKDYRPIMPTKVWRGVRETIPDDILERLCNVCQRTSTTTAEKEKLDDLRWHLKNYYTVVAKYGNDVIKGRVQFDQTVARCDLDGSRGVLKLLTLGIEKMKINSKKIIWPW